LLLAQAHAPLDLLDSPNQKEAVAAFREGRLPRFTP